MSDLHVIDTDVRRVGIAQSVRCFLHLLLTSYELRQRTRGFTRNAFSRSITLCLDPIRHATPAFLLWLAAAQLNSAGAPPSEGVVAASAPVAERSHCGIAPHFGWAEYVRAYVFLSYRELG